MNLPERVRSGELAALTDPSFGLHMLAEPDADWWLEGAEKYIETIAVGYVGMIGDSKLVWHRHTIYNSIVRAPSWRAAVKRLRLVRSWISYAKPEVDAAFEVLEMCVGLHG